MATAGRRAPKPDRPGWTNWRLYLPAYRFAEAARLAQTTPQTIARWYRGSAAPGHRMRPVLPSDGGRLLSYLQLVEVAFVADFRQLGVTLDRLRRAHEYLRKTFQAEFPFAQFRFKTDGVHVLAEFASYRDGALGKRLVVADQAGQLVWPELIADRLQQFDYEDGLAVRWHPRGRETPILIDPRVAFGAPTVAGTGVATWIARERFEAGETPEDIEADFGLTQEQLAAALAFEGVALPDARAARRRSSSTARSGNGCRRPSDCWASPPRPTRTTSPRTRRTTSGSPPSARAAGSC